MNKIWSKYVLFIAAVIITGLFLFRNHSPFGKNNTSFAVRPGTIINRIVLLQGDKRLTLRKERDDWTVNGDNDVRKSAISFILRTLEEIEIKSPVSPDIFRKEVIDEKIEPVRVNVFHNRRLARSFYVYKTGSNIYGNIMKMRPSSKPYIVYIPGYEDNIGAHFVLNELFWKPFIVYRLLPSEIESVSLENHNDPGASFIIRKDGDTFVPVDDEGTLKNYDSLRVRRYISYFAYVPFESWAFDLKEDEISQITGSEPLYDLDVRSGNNDSTRLTIWQKWLTKNGVKTKDTDRVWARTGESSNIFVMRYFDIDPILKKKSYFFGD
jgi:hypothetical protein